MGHSCFGYIDDTFVMGETYSQCKRSLDELKELLVSFGFRIHPDKSVFLPTKSLQFLGYVLNSEEMTVCPTADKIAKFQKASSEILDKKSCSIRELVGLIGLMVDYTRC